MKHAIVVLLLAFISVQAQKNLKLVSEWKDLEFAFPTPFHRQQAIQNGQYVPGTGVPIDVDVDYRDQGQSRIFMSIPRIATGIPITFGFVTSAAAAGGPIIQPYPNYDAQSSHGQNCDGITSVFRVAVCQMRHKAKTFSSLPACTFHFQIDECRRLWVLDTGRIADQQYCPPQLLVYALDNSDQLIHRYRFPANQYRPGTSLFITPVVDVSDPPPTGQCSYTRVYIADVTGYGILVYDLQQNRSWRVQNKLVFPHPAYATFTIAGESFDLTDGIIGMALSPRTQSRGKTFDYYSHHNHFNCTVCSVSSVHYFIFNSSD